MTDATYAGDLTPHEAWELLSTDDRAVLVDVRTDAEWRFVGVPDTADLPTADVPRAAFVEWTAYPTGERNPHFIDDLVALGVTPGRPVVVLCRSGVRSVAAAKAMTAAGFGPAFNVLEGFEGDVAADGHRGHSGWRAAGLPWRQA